MTTSIRFQEQIEIPCCRSLAEFRRWAASDQYPDNARVDYVAGHMEVETSPEDLFTHGNLKTKLIVVLGTLLEQRDLGTIFSDCTRIASTEADLSAEPDIVVVLHESLQNGQVRLVARSGDDTRFAELQGAPDLVVEIVSDSSVSKDTTRLPAAYWHAGIPEFWLIDARGDELVHHIYRRGPSAYAPASQDLNGFLRSEVFGCSFRLSRYRHAKTGQWAYDLFMVK